MSIRKLLTIFLCTAMCMPYALADAENTNAVGAPSAAERTFAQAAEPPQLYGAHAALLCAETGEILLSKDMDTPVAPASITKVMTALVVLEHCQDLSQQTTVSSVAVNSIEWDSTHIGLKAGEVVTVEQMMAVMLIQSANDAANVLAEYVGGSLKNFADMMNAEALALGCTHTHFVNAHGLDNPEHYTSAHDMALIGQAAVQYPAFIQFAGALEYTMPPTNLCAETRKFYTKQNVLCHNPEQYYYEGAFAGKNGWTTNAHQTLITFAKRNGVTLIAVTMQSDSKYNKVLDTIAMFDYGFQQFSMQTVTAQRQVKCVEGVIANYDTNAMQGAEVLLPNGISADALTLTPVDGAEPAITVSLGEQKLIEIPIIMQEAEAVETVSQEETPTTHGQYAMLQIFGWIALGGIAVFGLFALNRTIRVRRQRRRIRQRRQTEATSGSEIDFSSGSS